MFLQAQAIPLRQKSGNVGVYRMRSGAVVRKTNVGPAERVVEDASSAALRSGSRAQSGGRADETQSNGSVVSLGQPPAPKNGTGRGAPAGMNDGSRHLPVVRLAGREARPLEHRGGHAGIDRHPDLSEVPAGPGLDRREEQVAAGAVAGPRRRRVRATSRCHTTQPRRLFEQPDRRRARRRVRRRPRGRHRPRPRGRAAPGAGAGPRVWTSWPTTTPASSRTVSSGPTAGTAAATTAGRMTRASRQVESSAGPSGGSGPAADATGGPCVASAR